MTHCFVVSKINYKGMIIIKRINQNEAKIIRKKFPNCHIAVTNRQAPSRKKTYYCEERKSVMLFLESLEKAGEYYDGQKH